jgi:hypothetical protein
MTRDKKTIDLCGIRYVYDDGGRKAAGFKGKKVGDCACRAIAIATEQPYRVVFDALSAFGWSPKWNHPHPHNENELIREYLAKLGWGWTPTGRLGTACKVHMQADELPTGRLIVLAVGHHSHLVAVIDGVIHDDGCGRRDSGMCILGCPLGPQCVFGYFAKGEDKPLEYPDFSPFGHGLRGASPELRARWEIPCEPAPRGTGENRE